MGQVSPIRYVLEDFDWHKVGTPDEQYKVRSICNTALEMCCTAVGVDATPDTKAFFYLGGLINDVKTRPRFQNWIRATAIPSEYILNPIGEEAFDEMSAIRMAIAELQTNVLKVSNRVLNVENWKAIASRDWKILKYQLNHRIDHIFKTLARLIKVDALTYKQLHDVRMKLPKLSMRIDNLETMKASKSELEDQVNELLLIVSRNTKMNISLITKLLKLEFDMIKCKEDVKILGFTKGSQGNVDIDPEIVNTVNTINTQLNTLEDNINQYWDVCIIMANATTVSEINTIYNNFINSHEVPNTHLDVLNFAKDQAIKILQNVTVDTTQTTEITEINDFLNGLIVGNTINASDLEEIS